MSALLATSPHTAAATVSESLASWLEAIGVKWVFGVSGGGVAPLWGALCRAPGLQVVHTQHESGAAFCATEASLATGAPVVVFTTTGPGLTNALTGLLAAREEGARVLVFSGVTPTTRRFRSATQESGPSSRVAPLLASGGVFDLAATLEGASSLPFLCQRIEAALAGGGGFVAHIGVPTDLQGEAVVFRHVPVRVAPARPDPAALDDLASRLSAGRCAIVAGFGARGCAAEVRALAEALDAPVVVTPRGKGVMPARHPLHAGVLGFAGHDGAVAALRRHRPRLALVLGTSLGEGSSQYTDALDDAALVYAGVGHAVGALAPRGVEVLPGDVADVLRGLLLRVEAGPVRELSAPAAPLVRRATASVSPVVLLDAVQQICLDGGAAEVMAESGNAFAFAIHQLALDAPRLRVSVGWGSMGHFSAGVVGAALATGRRHVALVGDGSMVMQHELLTAARRGVDATWVVLNDSGYGMCRQGMAMIGIGGVDCELPEVDFAAWAGAMGVWARTVRSEAELDDTLREATTGSGPRLVDVRIDRSVVAPISGRVRQLTWSGDAPQVRS